MQTWALRFHTSGERFEMRIASVQLEHSYWVARINRKAADIASGQPWAKSRHSPCALKRVYRPLMGFGSSFENVIHLPVWLDSNDATVSIGRRPMAFC